MIKDNLNIVINEIINIIKTNDFGYYYLPEDVTSEFEYDFPNIPNFSIEFDFKKSNKFTPYYMDSYLDPTDSTIFISLYASKRGIDKYMFDISGDIHDAIAHEIEHVFQYKDKDFMVGNSDSTNKEYYLQEDEIDAQLKGFHKMIEFRGEKPDKVIREWFLRHKINHELNNEEIKELTTTLTTLYMKERKTHSSL